MTESNTVDKDTLICALVRKLGGIVSLTANDLTFGPTQVALFQSQTGTLHLELVAIPPSTSNDALEVIAPPVPAEG